MKSYPFFSQSVLQGNDSCPEIVYFCIIDDYFIFVHRIFLFTNSFNSTSRSFEILMYVSIGGWHALVHHLETVVGAHPNCSASHLLVLFFSARTTFIRLMSLSIMDYVIVIGYKDSHFILESVQYNAKFNFFTH